MPSLRTTTPTIVLPPYTSIRRLRAALCFLIGISYGGCAPAPQQPPSDHATGSSANSQPMPSPAPSATGAPGAAPATSLQPLAEIQSALIAGKIDKATYDQLKADIELAHNWSPKPSAAVVPKPDASGVSTAAETIAYWRTAYYLFQKLHLASSRPDDVKNISERIRGIPTKGVDPLAVETMLSLSEFLFEFTQLTSYAQSPTYLLEAMLRGANGDPLGSALEMTASGRQLQERMGRWESLQVRNQAALTAKYGVEFSKLPPMFRDVVCVDSLTAQIQPAAKSLKPGDIIVAVAGKAVSAPAPMLEIVKSQSAGSKFTVAYWPADGDELQTFEAEGGSLLGVRLRGDVLVLEYDVALEKTTIDHSLEQAKKQLAQKQFQEAIIQTRQCLRCKPDAAIALNAYIDQGNAYLGLKDWANVELSCGKAIALRNDHAALWFGRGQARAMLGKLDDAVQDFTEALEVDPDFGAAVGSRASILLSRRQWAEARKDYERAVELQPNEVAWCNGLAWLLATCPEASIRDTNKAVQYARQACELTNWKQSYYFDTLAAAYAASGDFDHACKWQERALSELKKGEMEETEIEAARQRLELYRSRRPFVEK